jgi:hypothetical protein
LGVGFEAHFDDFDSYIISLNIDKYFSFKGLDDVVFGLKGITIDQSDVENSGMTRFPQGYFGTNASSDPELQKLWKGVSIAEASVALPSFFKRDSAGKTDRMKIALKEALFDENGFTGSISAEDVIPFYTISPNDWSISLSDVSIGIYKNKVSAFGLSGYLNIPPFGTHSLLPYEAYYDAIAEQFKFKVNVAGQYNFPALYSTLTLNELSSIAIEYRNKELYPSINANGKITINAPLTEKDSTKKFSIPDITFENLQISREAPYFQIGSIGISGDLRSPNMGGFEIGLKDIKSFNADDGTGLSFIGSVSLGTDAFALSGELGVKLYGDYAKWRFKKIGIDKVHVSYTSKPFSIEGGVWFKNGDAVYGDGFRGDIKLDILGKFGLDAVAVFGKKDNYKYFLADVFVDLPASSGLPIPPIMSLYGFGGGLYTKMQQSGKSNDPALANATESGLEFGKSLSGISYIPDKTIGLGLSASVRLGLQGSKDILNTKVGFEMQFNNHGGLNFVQLRGEVSFMQAPDWLGSMSDGIIKYMKMLEGKGITKSTKSDLANDIPDHKSSSALSASILFEYDNINDYFNADLSVYLNFGILRGAGSNDRLGWANAYISKDKWHFFLGTPSDRLGIEVVKLARVDGYFMLGDDIPALPLPPNNVLQYLSQEKIDKLNKRNADQFGKGSGLAFGAGVNVGFDASFFIFFAKLKVGLGSEFMLTKLNGASCAGIEGEPGINGWFAQGQAWSYIEAALGVRAKIFGKEKRFPILDIGIGALLEAKGPNPLYFAGSVGGKYSILGGLIKGTCNFEFEMGEECVLIGGSPFGEDVIAQLTPAASSTDVNVFTSPQVVFNIPIETQITIDEDDGYKGTYRVHLETLTLKYKNGGNIAYAKKVNSDNNVCMLIPDEPFESQKSVEVIAKVVFQQLKNNKWETVKNGDGTAAVEEKKTEFKTGDRPKEIMPEHIAYSYPLNRQYNFYPQEYNQGYFLLSQNYSYLFTTEKPQGFNQKLRISTADGAKTDKDFSYTTNSSVSGIRMEITFPLDGANLEKNKIYHLQILNIPQSANASMTSNITESVTQAEGVAEGTAEITHREATGSISTLNEKEICHLVFKTSSHNTFSEKLKMFEKQSEGWRDYIEPYVHFIKQNLRESELFDAYETGSSNASDKLVQFNADINQTNWYTQTIYKKMYEKETYLSAPVQNIQILTGTPNKMLTDDEITMNSPSGYNTEGIIRYALSPACYIDLQNAKTNIARRVLNGSTTQDEATILATSFPPTVFKGNYPVAVSYMLPGKKIPTTTVSFSMYNPVEP